MSNKLELISALESICTGDRREREEIDIALDCLEQGGGDEIHETLWDTVLGCDTHSSRCIERKGQSGYIIDLAMKVADEALEIA